MRPFFFANLLAVQGSNKSSQVNGIPMDIGFASQSRPPVVSGNMKANLFAYMAFLEQGKTVLPFLSRGAPKSCGDMVKGEHELRGHTNEVNSVAWSPDGKRVVTGSDDKTAKIWVV